MINSGSMDGYRYDCSAQKDVAENCLNRVLVNAAKECSVERVLQGQKSRKDVFGDPSATQSYQGSSVFDARNYTIRSIKNRVGFQQNRQEAAFVSDRKVPLVTHVTVFTAIFKVSTGAVLTLRVSSLCPTSANTAR